MNELLAQLYGTHEKIASAAQVQETVETVSDEEALDEYIVAEIEKVAEAQGVDLNALSDEDLGEIFAAYKGELLKEASADFGGEEIDDATQEALSVGDLIGRTALHAFYDEANKVQAVAETHEKLAGLSDEEIFEGLAMQRAENILAALAGEPEGFFKEAALALDAEDEDLDDAITSAAADILDANGYDVDAIAAALVG
jgi:hypothetical protein